MTAQGEPPHRHHLPKMADDDDDNDHDNNHDDDDQHYPFPPPSYHPGYPDQYPPHPVRPHRTPPPHPNTPPPPQSHHPSPHTPRHATPPPPNPKHRSPTPPPRQKPPTPPPQKPRAAPPPYTNFADEYDDEDDKYGNLRRQICGVLTILLLLTAVAALVLWLIYRPHKLAFAATSAAVYSLNATPAAVSAAVQITVVARNPNRRTALHLDHLAVAVYYRGRAVTPPVSLPPLKLRPRTAVMMSPVVGGAAVAVEDAAEVAAGMVADEAYGVVGLSWVMVGRARYKAGGWFKSGHGRVYVKCDVIVGLRHGTPGVVSGGVFSNPTGQVPLLGVTPCVVDI